MAIPGGGASEAFGAIWEFFAKLLRGEDPRIPIEPGGAMELPITAALVLIDSYGSFKAFRADWKWVRLMLPLQGRLVVEQILWDRGTPWRSLVTGFRAIRDTDGTEGIFGAQRSDVNAVLDEKKETSSTDNGLFVEGEPVPEWTVATGGGTTFKRRPWWFK